MACKAECQEKGNRYCCLECPDSSVLRKLKFSGGNKLWE